MNNEKYESEFNYWKNVSEQEKGILYNKHYEQFYTEIFDLDKTFYNDKIILDIGCGPRGSLEWADMAKERIGLDPLVDKYKTLRNLNHKMDYVNSAAENIPFDDNYFDVVCSFNSLDHVDDLNKVISEIKRILKPGGIFLLITDVNHDPTDCEPIYFSWDIVDKFKPFELIYTKHFEKVDNGIYQSILKNIPYNHENTEKRYGILCAKFVKIV